MIALATSQCYDQNGVTTTDTACDSGFLPTFCCPSGYSCLSNGLCGKGDSLQMGSCSDQAWSGGSCVKYCPAGSNNIAVCKPRPKGNYCCGHDQSCCSGQDALRLGVLLQASTVPFTTLTGPNLSTTNAATTTTSSSTLSSFISVTAATTIMKSSTGSLIAVPTSSATGGMKTGAKIGTVFGVIGGFAIFGFLFYFLIFLLKHRKQEKYNAQRVAQIQAKVGRTFGSDHSGNGSFDRLQPRSLTTGFDISRSATPNLRAESERRPLPPLPPQYDTPQSYEPYPHLARSLTHELRNLEPLTIAQHTQLPSHYSFSGPPVTSPVSPTDMVTPPRRMTPVQEFAAAQLPSHFSFSGPAVTSPVTSPIDGSNELPPSMASTHQIASPTSPTSPTEGSNEPPPRLTPAQQYAAAQLPSHFSFQGPPLPVTNPVRPIEDPTRRPAGIQEMAAAQLPSHYSFSGPRSDFVMPVNVPARKMTPAQELASARLRSNMSPMGLAGMDD